MPKGIALGISTMFPCLIPPTTKLKVVSHLTEKLKVKVQRQSAAERTPALHTGSMSDLLSMPGGAPEEPGVNLSAAGCDPKKTKYLFT